MGMFVLSICWSLVFIVWNMGAFFMSFGVIVLFLNIHESGFGGWGPLQRVS